MKPKNLLAVLAGGAAAFIWSCISWMVIPWHQPNMNGFENENAFGQAIKEAAPEPGIYIYPAWTDDAEDMTKKHEEGPYVFASIVPGGVGSEMGTMMLGGFVANVIGAGVLLALMLKAAGADWKSRTRVALLAAVFISLIPALMNWNWWHFPVPYLAVMVIEGIIGWTLAGFVMAKITSRGEAA